MRPSKKERKIQAWEEYAKARGPALEEYKKVQGPAWEEYEKVQGPALEEYKRKLREIDAEEDV